MIESPEELLAQYFADPANLSQVQRHLQGRGIDPATLPAADLVKALSDAPEFAALIDRVFAAQRLKEAAQVQPDEQECIVGGKVLLKIQQCKGFDRSHFKKGQFKMYVTFLMSRRAQTVHLPEGKLFQVQFELPLQGEERVRPGLQACKQYWDRLEITIRTEQVILSLKQIEWRHILAHGSVQFKVELHLLGTPGCEERGRLGILDIALDLLPRPPKLLSDEVVTQWLAGERVADKRGLQLFYDYSQSWLKQLREQFPKLNPKIYVQTEDLYHRPVFAFVHPLRKVRGLDSPSIALRALSLLPITPGVQLCRKFANVFLSKTVALENVCQVFCSLLLGFGLKAFVARGSADSECEFWVVTLGKGQTTVWDLSQGKQLKGSSAQASSFKQVSQLYSDKQFHLNLRGAALEGVQLDPKHWRSLDQAKMALVKPQSRFLGLLPARQSLLEEETQLEEEVRKALTEERAKRRLKTRFDLELEGIMGMALANYQFEKVAGTTFDNGQFQRAVKAYVPEGYRFAGVPLQVRELRAESVLGEWLKKGESKVLLEKGGDSVGYGVRVKLHSYGESLRVGWAMLAGRWRG